MKQLPYLQISSLVAASATVEAMALTCEQYFTNKTQNDYMIHNIPMSMTDCDFDFSILRPIKPQMHQLNFHTPQRKKRKNARKAFAAGNRRAFDK